MTSSRERSKQRHQLKTEYFEALKETATVVDPYVESFINSHFQLLPKLKPLLIERYKHGKTQLRPAQVRFSYEIVGGQDWRNIVPVCAALTLKEICYYCFDDYSDLDLRSEKLPLLGTPFLSMSYGIIAELDNSFSAEHIKRITHEMYMLDELIGQGFLIEPEMSKDDEDKYWKKVYGYNFWEQALRIGSILGNGSEEDITRLGEIGKNIGMGYIIANDTWDFAKDLEDFRAGKYTLPIKWALKNTEDQYKKTLESLIGKKNLSEEEKDEVRRIMVKSGVIEYGKRRANELCEVALGLLSDFPDSKAKRMIEFSTTMTQRNKYYTFLKTFQ